MFKKLAVVCIVLLVLVGCSKKNEGLEPLPSNDNPENVAFKEVLDEMFVDFLDPKDFTLNLILKDPASYGIEVEPYELTFASQEDAKDWIEDSKAMLDDLIAFEDDTLSSQQILDKYVLVEYLEDTIAMAPYYDYEYGSSVIGVERALMGSLPAYLEAYTFRTQADVESYLHFLETLPNTIDDYIELEASRQKNGTGYSRSELQAIATQYGAIAKAALEDDYFLIDHFNSVIAELDFVEDKVSAKATNKRLIQTSLAKAYQMIADRFGAMEGLELTGLANKPNGKAYYEILLAQETGKKQSVEAIEKMVDKQYNQTLTYLQFLDETSHNEMFEKLSGEVFGDFKDGKALMTFLESAYQKDYPAITIPNYELRKVDESMSDTSSPAFYFTPPVDYVAGDLQLIYINGDFNNNLYTTYAHEGIPGHMYQFTYFSNLKGMHPIRNLITTSANAEGWANYAEKRAVSYISDDTYQAFYAAYQTLTEIAHIKADIGVNYHGWTQEELGEYFSGMFGELDADTVEEIYLSFVTNPAVYPTYYLSSLYFEELRLDAMQRLDENFDSVLFHQAVLDTGSASFDLIARNVERYIQDNQ